jgi:hypothetical protein
MKEMLIALACGWGQYPALDAYGNETCVQAQTGQVRQMEGRLSDCPTGTMPRLTERGSACVQKDTGQPYYDTRRQCPNGTARGLDQ